MKLRAGERLKGIRQLMGLTQSEFAEVLGIEFVRLRNLEQKKVRVSEDEFEAIGRMFPELIPWLTYEGDIDFDDLKRSEERLCRLIAARIEAEQIPEGFYLEEHIKRAS